METVALASDSLRLPDRQWDYAAPVDAHDADWRRRIRQVIEADPRSQREIAEAMGVDPSWISKRLALPTQRTKPAKLTVEDVELFTSVLGVNFFEGTKELTASETTSTVVATQPRQPGALAPRRRTEGQHVKESEIAVAVAKLVDMMPLEQQQHFLATARSAADEYLNRLTGGESPAPKAHGTRKVGSG